MEKNYADPIIYPRNNFSFFFSVWVICSSLVFLKRSMGINIPVAKFGGISFEASGNSLYVYIRLTHMKLQIFYRYGQKQKLCMAQPNIHPC